MVLEKDWSQQLIKLTNTATYLLGSKFIPRNKAAYTLLKAMEKVGLQERYGKSLEEIYEAHDLAAGAYNRAQEFHNRRHHD